MWYIRKVPKKKLWRWMIFLSSYGMICGIAKSRKAARKQLWDAQAELLSER
jgi:hypothetical protein